MPQYVMSMLRVSKIVPPTRQFIKDIGLSFFQGAKIGLLGLNGAGKSTVLRIMAGADEEFDGEMQRQSGIRVGYLPQEPTLGPTPAATSSRRSRPGSRRGSRPRAPTPGTRSRSPRTRCGCRPGTRG